MDAVIGVAAIIFLYVIGIYNRMQKLRQAVEETRANVGVVGGVGASAGTEQDLLCRGRCNAAIAAYNTYRAQFPQIVLCWLAGFQPVEFSTAEFSTAEFSTAEFSTAEFPAAEFPAAGRAVAPQPGAEIIQLEIPGPRKIRDPGALP
jgi:hypothetical protein